MEEEEIGIKKMEAEELTGKFEKILENERLNEYYLMKSPTQ